MNSAAPWLQPREIGRSTSPRVRSVLNTMGSTAGRPNNPMDSAPHQRGARTNERVWQSSSGPISCGDFASDRIGRFHRYLWFIRQVRLKGNSQYSQNALGNSAI